MHGSGSNRKVSPREDTYEIHCMHKIRTTNVLQLKEIEKPIIFYDGCFWVNTHVLWFNLVFTYTFFDKPWPKLTGKELKPAPVLVIPKNIGHQAIVT
jgi:hypothetical protein